MHVIHATIPGHRLLARGIVNRALPLDRAIALLVPNWPRVVCRGPSAFDVALASAPGLGVR